MKDPQNRHAARRVPRLRHPRKKQQHRPGTAPGTLHFDPGAQPPEINILSYSPEHVDETRIADPAEIGGLLKAGDVVWIDMVGFGQGKELEELRKLLGLHMLALEDAVNLGQRAKVDTYENGLFLVGRMADQATAPTEQVSLFLGEGWVLTIQERRGDPFEGVRERIRQRTGRIRSRGAGYLLYALLDAIVDSYFPVLDQLGDEIELLEEEVLESPDQETVAKIHATRRTLVSLRKALGPHREVLNALLRGEAPQIGQETLVFLRDVYDHTIRSVELTETYREMTGDLMSTYMSAVSNRMNEVMKVLTIIATIFIPLGFIAGLYGMNFDPEVSRWNMPELGWSLGYPFALGLMLAVAIGFVVYMARRGWLK